MLLQGQSASDASYLLYGRPKGPIFESAKPLETGSLPAAQDYTLLAGAYGGQGAGLYAQARSPAGDNALITLGLSAGRAVVVSTQAGVSPAFEATDEGGDLLAAAPEAGGMGPLALLTPNTPGRTPGQFAVSPMGAATYQIPIWTPPGARGLEPHLALVYTSGSPESALWARGGTSLAFRPSPAATRPTRTTTGPPQRSR